LSERRLPEPRLRDEFRRELRARLMQEAAVTLVPKRRDTAWTAWLRPAFAAGLAALVIIVGAGSAAANSLPGDPTFGLKRAMEEVRVALIFDDVERVRVLADLADQRLSELEKVASRDDKSPTASDEYAQAVARFRAAVDALQQAAPEDKSELAQDVADAAREKHEFILEQLRARLSERAKDAVDRATEEEQRDTPQNVKDKDKQEKKNDGEGQGTPGNNNGTPGNPNASPRGNERTSAPRTSPPAGRP
jgi:hypothetical protein